jgi:Zn finger protein HypA/HybF involved in hydrogenase expression
LIDDIGQINCSTPLPIPYGTIVIGNITSLGPIEQNLSCLNCHSNEIENNGKTIKCLACKTRSIKIEQKIDENKIKFNIIDINGNIFDIVTET